MSLLYKNISYGNAKSKELNSQKMKFKNKKIVAPWARTPDIRVTDCDPSDEATDAAEHRRQINSLFPFRISSNVSSSFKIS